MLDAISSFRLVRNGPREVVVARSRGRPRPVIRSSPGSPVRRGRPRSFPWLRLALAAVGATFALFLFRRVDWASALAHVDGLGMRAPLVVVPYFLMLLSDTLGWQATFQRPVRFAALLHLRVATEAVIASLPAGVAVGESLRVLILERRFGLSAPVAAANVVASKLAIALTQGVFIVGGVALALTPIETNSPVYVGRPEAGAKAMAGAVAFLVAMAGLLLLLSKGRALSRALTWVGRAGGPAVARRLLRFAGPVAQLDEGFAALARLPRRQIGRALLMFFVGWLCLGFENWLLLRLLSTRVSFAASLSIEAVVSVVRMGFFFLPGGLGAQDASYYGLLALYGVPNAEAAAAAFVVVKRTKELFWIALGYLLLASLPARVREVAEQRNGDELPESATGSTEGSSNARESP